MVIMLPLGANLPTDWTSRTDWEAVLANDNLDNTKGKYFRVIGSVLEPETQTAEVVGGKEVIFNSTYTLNARVNGISDTIYAFMQSLQCGPENYRLWYYDVSGYLYGGSTGIRPSYTWAHSVHPEGQGNYAEWKAILKWRSKCEPGRAYIPDLMTNLSGLVSGARVFGTATTVFGKGGNDVFAPTI